VPLRFAAVYQGKHYALAGPSELVSFLLRPTEALANAGLPKLLPTALAADEAKAAKLELEGFCPVALGRGPKGVDYESRVKSMQAGTPELAVRYDGKVFRMASAASRAEFLARPWRYASATLPAKLPPTEIELVLSKLPMRGYLEQTMGQLLVGALTELAIQRPIYPALAKRESALKFVSLYMRAHNPKRRPSHIKAKYDAALLDYTDCCGAADRLIQFQKEGGSSQEGFDIMRPPEDIQRANDMWDSILQRDLNDFF